MDYTCISCLHLDVVDSPFLPVNSLMPLPHMMCCLSRLASESADLQLQLKDSHQQREHLQHLVGEMNADMLRLAAEAAAGPTWVLSKDLQVGREIERRSS